MPSTAPWRLRYRLPASSRAPRATTHRRSSPLSWRRGWALQALRVQHLAPECEPGRSRALVEFLRSEIGIDHGLYAATRGGCEREARLHAQAQTPRQGAQGGKQQSILVAEIVRDQAWRHPGATGNLGQCAAYIAELGEAVDGHFDQLVAPRVLQLVPGQSRLRR